MAGNINLSITSSGFCQACGATNPAQATHCIACYEPLSTISGGASSTTNPLTGLLQTDVIIQQRYRIVDVLSAGAVSTVYKAEDMHLGNRAVTLKEIGKNNQNTQEDLALIEADRRETLLQASLIHIYDYCVENSRWYFVMDFLAGETLEAYLSKREYRPLPVEEVLNSGLQLSSVLDYLHIHQSPLDLNNLTLRDIWRTPDGTLYLLSTGITSSAAIEPASNSIYGLGKILRQLQTGKIAKRFSLRLVLPELRLQSRHPQYWELDTLIRQMAHRKAHKRPYVMGIVRQELQHLDNPPAQA
jgi:hypothetical protein